jgi:hypothetical protein
VRWSAVWILKSVMGDDLLARLVASSRYKDVYEFKEWEAHKDAYIPSFMKRSFPSHSDRCPSANCIGVGLG